MLSLATALERHAPAERVPGYYLPVAQFCLARLEGQAACPLLVGISGPQGSGKSTLAAAVTSALSAIGRPALAISIDDFYLTHAEQRALAAAHPGNRYLEHRGYPGTHDVELGWRTLRSLRAGTPTEIPVYDKSAHAGRGDRAPDGRRVEGRLDLVVLEGWMLGFEPVDASSLEPDLRPANAALARYAAWHSLCGALVRLDAEHHDDVVRWRIDAERARRARGEAGLSDEDARDYVERFLPAYRTWVPGLRAHPPVRPCLAVALDVDRGARVAPAVVAEAT